MFLKIVTLAEGVSAGLFLAVGHLYENGINFPNISLFMVFGTVTIAVGCYQTVL